jgi:hypothetical protein
MENTKNNLFNEKDAKDLLNLLIDKNGLLDSINESLEDAKTDLEFSELIESKEMIEEFKEKIRLLEDAKSKLEKTA